MLLEKIFQNIKIKKSFIKKSETYYKILINWIKYLNSKYLYILVLKKIIGASLFSMSSKICMKQKFCFERHIVGFMFFSNILLLCPFWMFRQIFLGTTCSPVLICFINWPNFLGVSLLLGGKVSWNNPNDCL